MYPNNEITDDSIPNSPPVMAKSFELSTYVIIEYLSLFPALAVSYYSNKKGLKAELGSDRLLGVPLETYIPSEKLAIESGSTDENIEIMKAYMCKQRGIRLIKLPMKGTELDYANNLKKAFQSVHIFISSDTEEDVEIIKNTFERWRDSQ